MCPFELFLLSGDMCEGGGISAASLSFGGELKKWVTGGSREGAVSRCLNPLRQGHGENGRRREERLPEIEVSICAPLPSRFTLFSQFLIVTIFSVRFDLGAEAS